ncbi:MAG: hydroxyacid dehydrogenase [Fusobacteriaceae bacterium]|nr:hydroxyacid dehydrogenase [Fusobacteriaceae bacterium]
MKKVIVTKHLRKEGLSILGDKVKKAIVNDSIPDTFVDEWKDANGIIIWGGKVGKNDIENAPNLEVIATVGVGYDNVDVDAATKHGIPVCISAGANARAVAEITIGLLLAVDRRIVEEHAATRAGTALRFGGHPELSFELYEKTMGLIGLGNIGKLVGKMAEAFGMKVIGYDPYVTRDDIEKLGWTYYENCDDVLKNADVVSIHVPKLPSTTNFITMRELKLMKNTAVILNTARGGIINENDLADALNNDIIAGAALDVFENEPPSPDSKLLHAKNLVCAPHNGAQTLEAMINMNTMCTNAVLAVLNGEKWAYVANPEVYNHPKWKK